MTQYGYARAEDAERWSGHEETIEAAIYDALTRDDLAMPSAVFICECDAPEISYESLADEVVERVGEQLYEEVGEVADAFGPFEKSEMSELADLIKGWVEKQGAISCWKANNIKRYAPGDAEYDAALARFEADQVPA
ncbi:hypothetical protein NE850_18070 [Paraburkholderia sp. USG1]|nr:hypothetical protein [Paraburkholderia sp. USG1]